MSSYGTYLSASGIRVNSHRIDTISNNLANAETTGFKRALSEISARPAEAERGALRRHPEDHVGGGVFIGATRFDTSQGPLESTSSPLDVAFHGPGYFAIREGTADDAPLRLTRDGQFMIDREGALVTDAGHPVLDPDGNTIFLGQRPQNELIVDRTGVISHRGVALAEIGRFLPADPAATTPLGGNLLDPRVETTDQLPASLAELRGSYIEAANVDPTVELTNLLEAQRQLEANANFLKFQDEATGKLVNEVGRIV